MWNEKGVIFNLLRNNWESIFYQHPMNHSFYLYQNWMKEKLIDRSPNSHSDLLCETGDKRDRNLLLGLWGKGPQSLSEHRKGGERKKKSPKKNDWPLVWGLSVLKSSSESKQVNAAGGCTYKAGRETLIWKWEGASERGGQMLIPVITCLLGPPKPINMHQHLLELKHSTRAPWGTLALCTRSTVLWKNKPWELANTLSLYTNSWNEHVFNRPVHKQT